MRSLIQTVNLQFQRKHESKKCRLRKAEKIDKFVFQRCIEN